MWQYVTEDDVKIPVTHHLLGDKAYPLLEKLLVPYRDVRVLTPQERNFNYRLSSVRNCIERAFALLKKRWRCLKFLDVRNIEWIPKYIMACCVLHNICIMENDLWDLDVIEINNADDNIDLPNFGNQRREFQFRNKGVYKRNLIANRLHDNY